jgi:hypothetical protein
VNTGAFEGTTNVLAVPVIDDNRLGSLFNVDLRLAKNFNFGGGTNMTISVEGFNIFNSNTVINRVVNASAAVGVFDRIEEIMAPRIFRIGARFGF